MARLLCRRWMLLLVALAASFQPAPPSPLRRAVRRKESDGEIFEAFDEPPVEKAAVAASPAAATTPKDDSDEGKNARVLTYMGLSLLPILALIPFLLGRDFVPADPSQFT
mmetsp:Transcript_35230/g.112657  ORF Transcript_35230/g.112657 Transcript_35230/m.112657 type:complete len:110 (+) Transcript_35230:62-391(+)